MSEPTDEELAARYRPRLLAEQAELSAASDSTRESRKPVTLDQQSVGRLSRMDALQNQAMAQATGARRTAERQRLVAALKRMDDGEFGYCEECGDEIAEARLRLDPAATRCVDCARG